MKWLIILYLICFNSIQAEALSFPFISKHQEVVNKSLTGIDDIFRAADHGAMQLIIQNQNVNGANAFYNSFGLNIASYLESVYAENFLNELEDMPEAMVVLGMFRWGVENNVGPLPLEDSYAPDDDKAFNCFLGAVNGLIGISDIVGLYNEFKSGASAKTILRSLRVALRRVATVFVIVTSVYGLGSCMNWW